MLLSRSIFALAICLLATSQVNAGMSMNYSGKASHHRAKSFNFAVSSTSPTMLGSTPDSPSEPVLDSFFPRLLELRSFSGLGSFMRFQAPSMQGGGSNSNGSRTGRFGGMAAGGPGMGGKSGYGSGGGGFGGSAGFPNGANTTSGDQSVSGTGEIACGPGGPGGDDGTGGSTGGGPDGGETPSPSAVPEPNGLVLWSLVTCMLIFGTRRVASRR